MTAKTCGTGEYTLKSSSLINMLFDEADRGAIMRRKIGDVPHSMRAINSSIAGLQRIRSGLELAHEIDGISQMIDQLSAKSISSARKQKAEQLNLQQTRDTGQEKLGLRVGKRLEQEIRNIHNQNRKNGRTTPNKIAAAGLAAHIYEAIIFGDLLDNQPQERNNHDS